MPYPFFAMISRMKYISRWGLMRNTRGENIQEHSLQVALIAHALAVIRNEYFGGGADADRAAVMGMFHDCDEIITGDMPTPVKYFNDGIREAYREVEQAAREKLLGMLPPRMRPVYAGFLAHGGAGATGPAGGGAAAGSGDGAAADGGDASDRAAAGGGDAALWRLVKAADTISAHIKCLEELTTGNTEFTAAAEATRQKVAGMGLAEADFFMKEFVDAFRLSLDEVGL
jgi:5'-deoxynucleotidase